MSEEPEIVTRKKRIDPQLIAGGRWCERLTQAVLTKAFAGNV
jgi:hypothetical protein